MNRSTPGLPVHHQLPEFTQTHVHLPKLMSIYPNPCPFGVHLPKPMSIYPNPCLFGDAIQPSHPLSSPSPASIFPSIKVFSNESTLHMRWPKYWSFSFIISPSNEPSGLISFRMDWLDLLAVQGTLKSLLQHHSLKASVFRRSAFFRVQILHPYMTTGKTIALTRWTLCWQSNVSAF